jgi:hypothetical protein
VGQAFSARYVDGGQDAAGLRSHRRSDFVVRSLGPTAVPTSDPVTGLAGTNCMTAIDARRISSTVMPRAAAPAS